MIKTKFIQAIFAAAAMSTTIAYANDPYYATYTYSNVEGSDLKDVRIELTSFDGSKTLGPGTDAETGKEQCVLQGGTFPSGPSGLVVGVNGLKDYPYSWQNATHSVVRNSEVYADYGEGKSLVYLTADAAGTGQVTGTKTVTFASGHVQMIAGGTVSLSDAVPDGGMFSTTNGRPVTSTAKTVINVINNASADKILGGCNTSGFGTDKEIGFLALNGDVEINVKDKATINDEIRGGGGGFGCVNGKVSINIKDKATIKGDIYGGARRTNAFVNSTTITISDEAQIEKNVYGGGSYSEGSSVVKGDTEVVINGGTVEKNVYGGGDRDIVKGNSTVVLKTGKVNGAIYASGADNTTEGTATVQILSGDWSETQIFGKTEKAEVKGGTQLIVGSADTSYSGALNIAGFDSVRVSKGSKLNLQSGNLFDVTEHSYTITANNLGTDGVAISYVTPNADMHIDKPITLIFSTDGRLESGRYKVIDATEGANVDTEANWDSEHVTVNGANFDDLVWDGEILYIDYVSPAVDAAMAGNWGVFKSSQAFTGTLWGNRTNACVLSKPAAATDAKGVAITPAPTGVTLAWGTVYGQSARISGVGADYSLYGGAIGVEHQFASGRSIGAALGYDWGEVSPFGGSKIDQESFHAAVYGRAGIWQVSSNSAVAVDWSAAFGDTTSENDVVNGDWSQDSLQLDARVSYLRKLNDRTTGSLFAGMQYFAADSDTVDGLEVSSMQNLRAEIGAGISYQLTQKATVYGEASVYNDLMRHNPYVADAGQHFKGTNPGRTGGSLNMGVQYELNIDWTVRGGYSFDVAEDSTEHNINAGAVYKF